MISSTEVAKEAVLVILVLRVTGVTETPISTMCTNWSDGDSLLRDAHYPLPEIGQRLVLLRSHFCIHVLVELSRHFCEKETLVKKMKIK